MRTVLELLMTYADIGILCLAFLQMIMIIAVIHMVRRQGKQISKIQNKVLEYLEVVMEEESPAGESPEHVLSVQERQMTEALARKQKNQQEELFNAVLQEIFP